MSRTWSMQCLLASSFALAGSVLAAALRLTHFGWSRVSADPDEEDKGGDGDDAAEGGREASSSTGHRCCA